MRDARPISRHRSVIAVRVHIARSLARPSCTDPPIPWNSRQTTPQAGLAPFSRAEYCHQRKPPYPHLRQPAARQSRIRLAEPGVRIAAPRGVCRWRAEQPESRSCGGPSLHTVSIKGSSSRVSFAVSHRGAYTRNSKDCPAEEAASVWQVAPAVRTVPRSLPSAPRSSLVGRVPRCNAAVARRITPSPCHLPMPMPTAANHCRCGTLAHTNAVRAMMRSARTSVRQGTDVRDDLSAAQAEARHGAPISPPVLP